MRAKIDKLYGRLTPHERFQLVMRAGARSDGPEVESLVRSCPWRRCRGPDLRYTDRLDAARDIVAAFVAQHAGLSNQIVTLETVVEALRPLFLNSVAEGWDGGYRAAARDEGSGGAETVRRQDEIDEEEAMDEAVQASWRPVERFFERVKQRREIEMATLWRAFDTICTGQIGVDLATLLGAFLDDEAAKVARGLGASPDSEIDVRLEERWKAAVRERWEKGTALR